jgi:hypothetical protein
MTRFDTAGAPARLDLAMNDGRLVLEVTGNAAYPEHADRLAIVDRVEAAGGRLTGWRDPEGQPGTRVEFPVPGAGYGDAEPQTAASRSVPNTDLTT